MFLHTADLHLDSALKNLGDAAKAAVRRRELTDTFERMADYARDNDVCAVIIAGDLFDEGSVTFAAQRETAEIIRSHGGVTFFILSGNHDKKAFDDEFISALPENAVILQDGKTLDFGDFTITGVYDGGDNLPVFDKDKFNITVMHGQTGGDINTRRLAGKNINYLALGHLHTYAAGNIDGRGIWVYSGCPEGRGFDETGEKGFVLFDTFGGEKFVPFCKRQLREIKVDITGTDNYMSQVDAARRAVEHMPDGDMFKIVLRGELDEGVAADVAAVREGLGGRFFVRVTDETTIRLDEKRLLAEKSLKGEFFRAVKAAALPPEEKRVILKMGFAALDGTEICDD